MKLILLACLLTLSLCITARADELRGVVIRVSDGDTITVATDDGQRVIVRLAGIDAPEKRQEFGKQAGQVLATLVLSKEVSVLWLKRDRYGRVLGRLCTGATNINLLLIKKGAAWYAKPYAQDVSPVERGLLAAAEGRARRARRGLWAGEPIAPWVWRQSKKGREAVVTPRPLLR